MLLHPPGFVEHRDLGCALQVEQRAYLADSLPAGEWQRLMTQMQADSAGYVEVTLQDESPEAAYFDDLLLRIAQEKGIQENHYDPWGQNLIDIER